ncbi:MAG TPA: hypothetical protein VNI01_03755 [Elusimicrobiota bacterium]|jgi:hypothetical protein|nr:hypothetical protein [Elusimicrobiota bacterium]
MVADLAVEVFSPSGLDKVLEAHLARLEAGAREEFSIVFRADRVDAAVDPILEARMRSAPISSIAAAYRVLLGKVGASACEAARQRLARSLNSARFEALSARGARAPRFSCVPEPTEAPDPRLIDKLANYQIDLDVIARELESRR